MKKSTRVFIILGVIPTILMFATHDIWCGCGMNPICFFKCLWFLFVGFLVYVDCMEDDEGNKNK